MTIKELAQLVRDMRTTQREYFKTRQLSLLTRSKQLEKQVDAACSEVLDTSLFDESGIG